MRSQRAQPTCVRSLPACTACTVCVHDARLKRPWLSHVHARYMCTHGACVHRCKVHVQGARLERELLELLLLLVERRLERALLRGDPLHLVRVRLRSHRVEEGRSTHSTSHRVRGSASHRVSGIVPGCWQPSPRPWQRPRPPRAASSSPPSRSHRSRTHLVRDGWRQGQGDGQGQGHGGPNALRIQAHGRSPAR